MRTTVHLISDAPDAAGEGPEGAHARGVGAERVHGAGAPGARGLVLTYAEPVHGGECAVPRRVPARRRRRDRHQLLVRVACSLFVPCLAFACVHTFREAETEALEMKTVHSCSVEMFFFQ